MQDPAPETEIKPWKILSSERALDEKWFMVRKDRLELPSGKIVDDYFLWESPDIAVVVPFTNDGKFVLCQQYRHAVSRVMWQFPGGAVGKNEAPEDAARRELREECGYVADNLTHLVDTAAYATKLTGWQHIFLAKGARFDSVPEYDPEEPTRVVTVSPDELRGMIDNNDFQVPDALAAALLAMHKLGV